MSDNVTQVTDQDFDSEVLGSSRAVLVDFWAEWCVPCHMVSPLIEEIARSHPDQLKAVKLNVDDNPQTSLRYGVMSIPTLIMFKDGNEVARITGVQPKASLKRTIDSVVGVAA